MIAGLESANTGLSSALRVVEGGNRTVPSQAVELYHEADQAATVAIAAWTELKSTELVKLNQALLKAGGGTVQISEIELELEYWMSQ